jgi:DNA-binding transcriptional LysR family regulator
VVQGVLAGELELGMVGARWEDRRIVSEELFSDELVLAIFPGHPWENKESVDLEDLAGEAFVLREKGSGTRIVMQQALQEHGFDLGRLTVAAEMGSTEAVRQAIKARVGVSILSYHAVAEDLERGGLLTRPLDRIRIARPFFMILRKNRQPSPLSLAFQNHLRLQDRAQKG